jgi:hypothetical protein
MPDIDCGCAADLKTRCDYHTKAITYARNTYAAPSDNELEIDDLPHTSTSDEGCWVAAWVWVANYEIGETDDETGRLIEGSPNGLAKS